MIASLSKGPRPSLRAACYKFLRNCPCNRFAGWVARTRPLAGPLSPRGSQPVLSNLRSHFASANGSTEPTPEYAGCSTKVSDQVARSIRPVSNHILWNRLKGAERRAMIPISDSRL